MMNVFTINAGIRDVGYNCGVPCWTIECGLGTYYAPEDLLRKLASMGVQEKDWVVIRNGMSEKGLGTLVDALSYVHCRTEVEAYGRHPTPAWMTKATRWTVYWDGARLFNFGALRGNLDIILSEDLDSLVGAFGTDSRIEKGYVMTHAPTPEELKVLLQYKIRAYRRTY